MVSLNWGGKRDYATWFSPEPSAILGIQLIPMGPVQTSIALGVDPEQIRASVEEATPGGYGVQFGGYLLMYRALAGADDAAAAWQEATSLPDVAIDDGSSRVGDAGVHRGGRLTTATARRRPSRTPGRAPSCCLRTGPESYRRCLR